MASSKRRKAGRLILYDALTAPRQPVMLEADLLEESFLRTSGLGGEVILFQHEGRPIGQAMTGGDGRAVRSLTPMGLGVTTISVRLADPRRVTATDNTARLFVWEHRRPLALISLQALSSRAGSFPKLPLSESKTALPDPDTGAVTMLSKVAPRVGLLYLGFMSPADLPDIRQWAERHHLPAAPVFLVRGGAAALGRQLDRLQQRGWTKITGGIAGTPDEAKILLAKGKLAIAPPPAGSREKWPEKTVKPKDWEEAGKRLVSS